MAKCGCHRTLIMSVPRHQRQPVFICPQEKCLDQMDQSFDESEDLVSKVETHVQGNLIISAPACVDLSSGFDAYRFNEVAFDV